MLKADLARLPSYYYAHFAGEGTGSEVGQAIKQMQVRHSGATLGSRPTCLVSRPALSATARCCMEMFLAPTFSSSETGMTSNVRTSEPHAELGRLTDVLTAIRTPASRGCWDTGFGFVVNFLTEQSKVVRATCKSGPSITGGVQGPLNSRSVG